MRIKFTLFLVVLFFTFTLWGAFTSHANNQILTFSAHDIFSINTASHIGTKYGVELFYLVILLLLIILFSKGRFYCKCGVFGKFLFSKRKASEDSVQYYLKCCSIAVMILPLLFPQISYGQCLNVNGSSWNKNTSVANNIIYNDGTQTRLANSASGNARIADGAAVNWSTAVYTTPTRFPPASGTGTVTVPVGQKQTISAIYAATNTTPTNNSELFKMGWAYSTAFTGAGANGTSYTGNTITQWNSLWAVNLAVTYWTPGVTNLTLSGSDGNSTIFYAGSVLPGDSLAVTLIPH